MKELSKEGRRENTKQTKNARNSCRYSLLVIP
jgi:hypothetical protein